MRTRLLLLAALSACTDPDKGASVGVDSGSAGDGSGQPALQPLRVGSFNADWLWSTPNSGETPRNTTDYQMVGSLLADQGFELVGMQEVDGPGALALLELDADWDWVTGESGWNQNVGILWRDDLVRVSNAREVQLPSFQGSNKMALAADVTSRTGDLAFSLVVVHHKPYSTPEESIERQTQTRELHTWVVETLGRSTTPPYDENIVVLGDFNDTFDGINRSYPSLLPFMEDPRFDFATAYTSHYTHILYESQIDHIIVSDTLFDAWVDDRTREGVHIIPHEQTPPWSNYSGGAADPSPTISDHRPLWVGLDHGQARR